jgi:hypothetical protein
LLAIEEEDDEDSGWFYRRLDEEGRRGRDRRVPRPTLLLSSMEMTRCRSRAGATIVGSSSLSLKSAVLKINERIYIGIAIDLHD